LHLGGFGAGGRLEPHLLFIRQERIIQRVLAGLRYSGASRSSSGTELCPGQLHQVMQSARVLGTRRWAVNEEA
jgi:hypothetical protein